MTNLKGAKSISVDEKKGSFYFLCTAWNQSRMVSLHSPASYHASTLVSVSRMLKAVSTEGPAHQAAPRL